MVLLQMCLADFVRRVNLGGLDVGPRDAGPEVDDAWQKIQKKKFSLSSGKDSLEDVANRILSCISTYTYIYIYYI